MGVMGALSCAVAGVTGTATKIHKKVMEGENKVTTLF